MAQTSALPQATPTPGPTLAPVGSTALPPVGQVAAGPDGLPWLPWPSDLKGTVTLAQPGFVPLTFEAGESPPPGLSLSVAQAQGPGGLVWRLSGQVAPAQAGVLLTLSRPGLAPEVLGMTNAQGAFQVQTRSQPRPEAILVARTQDNLPLVALQRLQLPTEGGELTGLALKLGPAVASYRLAGGLDFGPNPLPEAPPGLSYTGGAILAYEGGSLPWVAELFSLPSGMLATYRIGDFALGRLERTRNPEGSLGADVAGSLETGFPPFLLPPNLDGVERPSPGGRVAWPPVEGAATYRLRLRTDDGSDRLLWEAAVRQANAPVPPDAPAFEGPLRLEVEALQAAGARVYDLAGWGPRALRLGEGIPSMSGRRSWAHKRF